LPSSFHRTDERRGQSRGDLLVHLVVEFCGNAKACDLARFLRWPSLTFCPDETSCESDPEGAERHVTMSSKGRKYLLAWQLTWRRTVSENVA
jgi:hypothetical protein